MYTLNIASAIKKMAANKLRNFIFENYYKRIGFIKKITYYSKQRLRKRFDIACTEINRKRADPNNITLI